MFNNYLKIALRNIYKTKRHVVITITGLAVGIAGSVFIRVYVQAELRYNRFHHDVRNICQVLSHTDVENNSVTPTPLGPVLKEDFPEIEKMTGYHWIMLSVSLWEVEANNATKF